TWIACRLRFAIHTGVCTCSRCASPRRTALPGSAGWRSAGSRSSTARAGRSTCAIPKETASVCPTIRTRLKIRAMHAFPYSDGVTTSESLLVRRLIDQGIRDPRVLAAFARVPPEVVVPEDPQDQAE